jgi:glucosamine-phosphate N-acetyltransferase
MENHIQLQKLQKEDYHTNYFSLLRQLTSLNSDRITFEDFSNFIDSLNDNHQIWVIKDTHRNYIIGTGTLLIEQKIIHDMGKVGHIEDIVIDQHSRGYKYGLMIVNHLRNIASEKGCYKSILDCKDHLEYFYKKCGFTKKGIQMTINH